MNTAYACSPVTPTTINKITNISITSSVDFTVKITLSAEVLDQFVFTTNPVEIRI